MLPERAEAKGPYSNYRNSDLPYGGCTAEFFMYAVTIAVAEAGTVPSRHCPISSTNAQIPNWQQPSLNSQFQGKWTLIALTTLIFPSALSTSACMYSIANKLAIGCLFTIRWLFSHSTGDAFVVTTAGGASVVTAAGGASVVTPAGGASVVTATGGASVVTMVPGPL